jgi:hypothetical protein
MDIILSGKDHHPAFRPCHVKADRADTGVSVSRPFYFKVVQSILGYVSPHSKIA